MTTRDIAHHRLVNQNIASARCSEPGEVAAALGAMQAQDWSSPEKVDAASAEGLLLV